MIAPPKRLSTHLRHRFCHLLLVIPTLLSLALPAALAQVTNATGTIQGTVTDPSGAAVPSAKITLTEPSTGLLKVVNATGSGYYSVGSLLPGSYAIRAEAPGFATTNKAFTVSVGVVTNGNLQLGVGSTTTEVQVESNAIGVDTQQTQIAGVLSREQIATLPLNGRNFLDLAQLQPGVQIQDGTSFDPTKNGFSSISFGGRFGRTARIELDGLDISDENVGTTTQNISTGAIQEFQIAQSNLDISTSITSSGSVNVVSRSGTNSIHGDEFYNFRDKRAGGANFPGGQNNYLQRNNFGGDVGGALIPDKAFYFFSGERIVQHLSAPVTISGPLSGKSGSYSAPYSELELLGRFDFNLIHGAKGFIRGAYHNNKDVGGFGGGNNYSPYLDENNTPNVGGGIDFLTGRFSHSFRAGYFKFVNHLTDATATTNNPTYNSTPGIYLVISPFSSGANANAPQASVQTNKQLKYDGSWTKGNHTLRYGAGINHLLGGGFASFYGIDPQVQLNGNVADGTNPGDPANYLVESTGGQAIVLGNGQGFNTEIPSFGYPGGGQEDWRFTAYVGDQWKLSSRINVNFGVRYIRDTGRSDSDLGPIPAGGPDSPAPGASLNDIQAGLANRVQQPNKNWGPQAGIAWDLTGQGKTVIRAGAGIYYENNVWNNILFDRPVRLSQGLFFGDAQACPKTSITIPGTTVLLKTVDGTPSGFPISGICGQPVGKVYQQIATLEHTYQRLVTAAGPQANGNYFPNALAVGPSFNGEFLFLPKYKTPSAYQMNIGIQRQIAKNTVISVDYLRNVGLHFLIGIDQNQTGDVRHFNKQAATAAVAATVAACGTQSVDEAIIACPGLHPASATSPVKGAVIGDFAANGLDSIGDQGGAPNPSVAFGGIDPKFGLASFLTPGGRSDYNALAITVTQRSLHPMRGIASTDLTASYNYSHFNSTGTIVDTTTGPLASGGDQDFGENALSNNNPGQYFGPSSLDRHQQFSIGLDAELFKGFQFDTIAHLYSSLPLTLSLPAQGAGDIFISDLDGDGTTGDIVPGSNVGSFMRGIGPHSINTLINNYNSKYSNTFTPAGVAVLNSGALTSAQLRALGGVQQKLLNAPVNQVGNDILRIWDLSVGYNFKLGEHLSIQPSVHAFNVLNTSNFDGPGGLGLTRLAGTLASNLVSPSAPAANTTTPANQDAYRVGLGTGVFSFGAPRQLEFGLKATF